MKILVSSKGFSQWLKAIGIKENHNVSKVKIEKGMFYLNRNGYEQSIFTESKDNNCEADQNNVRWDWLYRDLRGIQEQPVVIEFLDNKATFTLTY